jgi:signal transduction histidine kinase
VLPGIANAPRKANHVAMRALRLAAMAVATVTFVTLAVAAVAQVAGLGPASDDWIPLWLLAYILLAWLAPAVVGLLIALRKPSNVIAWIMLLGAFALALPIAVEFFVSEGWTLQIDRATWPLLYAWPIAVTYVFPDGRLLSRRWRWVAGAGAASFVCFTAIALLDPEPFYGDDASVPNPIAGNAVGEWLVGGPVGWIWIVFWLGILASLLAGVLAIRLRLRRATGIERLQTLWLAWAAALIPVGLLFCGASSWLFGDSILDWILFPFLLLMEVAVAAAIGIAVARYQLYAIERLVNRTVVYASVTLVLLGIYAAITVTLGVLIGAGSAWVTAAATLAAALAFRPLRARVQDLVDRRYARARYDGVRRVRAFEDEVRDGRRAPEEIAAVLAEALDDPTAELLFWLPETAAFADATGAIVDAPLPDARARAEIERKDARTGLLLHDAALSDRRDLLDGVLAAAALSIEMARLRVELRLQLAEVEASRTRIVEAGYEERRRLERDLHDGAQQRLVSLGVQLRRLQRSLPRGAQILSPALDQIVAEVGAAIGDLRQIAAGVRPARLDDGLGEALRDLARSAPVPVEVDVTSERVAASIEAAAYFVACEALTNALKHAAASRVAVSAVRENGTLHVRIADDGLGGASVRRGSGLAGLADRVAAHGGTLEVISPRGGGTRIEAAIPCDS